MTVHGQSRHVDQRIDHEKVRKLFRRFNEARGEEKKAVAREIMNRLVAGRAQS